MKNALNSKLHNRQGASILMALFLLVVVTVISVVIITVATTAAHQIRDNKEAQQAYLTVSSAAEFMRDEIENQSYVNSHTTYTPASSGAGSRADTDSDSTVPTGTFKALLKDLSMMIKNDTTDVPGQTITGASKHAVIKVDGMDDVDVDVYLEYSGRDSSGIGTGTSTTMRSYYKMIVRLSVSDVSEDGYGYRMEMTIPQVTKDVTVSQGTITENGKNKGENAKKWTTTTTVTTVSWDRGTMEKGWSDGSN